MIDHWETLLLSNGIDAVLKSTQQGFIMNGENGFVDIEGIDLLCA